MAVNKKWKVTGVTDGNLSFFNESKSEYYTDYTHK